MDVVMNGSSFKVPSPSYAPEVVVEDSAVSRQASYKLRNAINEIATKLDSEAKR